MKGRIIAMEPRPRVVLGRNITLTAGVVYALSRCVYYATANPSDMSGAQAVATANGGALGAWAALWGFTAILCIADMVNRHTRYGLSLLTGIAFAWGFGYLIMWAASDFRSLSLLNGAVGWLAPASFIFGFLIKVTALQDMLNPPETDGAGDDR